MPLEKLLQRIEKDAVQEAKELKKSADNQAAQIIEQEQALIAEQKDIQIEIAKIQSNARENAIIASANLEAKDILLKTKREVLDKAFALALEKLNKLEGEAYQQVLSKLKDRYSSSTEKVIETKEKGLVLVDEDGAQTDLTFNNLVDYHKAELEQEVYKVLIGKQGHDK